MSEKQLGETASYVDGSGWGPVIPQTHPAPLKQNGSHGEEKMAKARVFISFDYDHDDGLKTMLVGQSKNPDTPFELADWS